MIKFENFKKVLTDNGVSDTRVAIMADAVNYLHTAINEMDQRQRENFLDVFGDVAGLVNDFASAEGLNKIRAHGMKTKMRGIKNECFRNHPYRNSK